MWDKIEDVTLSIYPFMIYILKVLYVHKNIYKTYKRMFIESLIIAKKIRNIDIYQLGNTWLT